MKKSLNILIVFCLIGASPMQATNRWQAIKSFFKGNKNKTPDYDQMYQVDGYELDDLSKEIENIVVQAGSAQKNDDDNDGIKSEVNNKISEPQQAHTSMPIKADTPFLSEGAIAAIALVGLYVAVNMHNISDFLVSSAEIVPAMVNNYCVYNPVIAGSGWLCWQ